MPLTLAYINYEKAFDTLKIHEILKALDDYRIDTKYTNIIKNIYRNLINTIKLKIPSDKFKIERENNMV